MRKVSLSEPRRQVPSSCPAAGWRSRFHGIATGTALAFSSLIVTLLLLELAFRLFAPLDEPGTTYGKLIVRNTFGFRDRDFVVPKPEGTYRIVMIGDSFAWGVGLDVEQALPKVLEKGLSAAKTRGEIEVVNAAEPGHNTVEEFLLLEEKGLGYEPDMVILIYNLNDIEFLPHLSKKSYVDKPTPIVEIDPGEKIVDYSRNAGFRGLVLEVERHSIFIRFLVPRVGAVLRRLRLIESVEFSWVERTYQGFNDANPGWLESKRALGGIAELCRTNGCDFLVAIYPLFADLEAYKGKRAHQTVSSFCRDREIPAVDLLPVFENTRTRSHWINFMDSHPNAAAHQSVADKLLPIVQARLPEWYFGPTPKG